MADSVRVGVHAVVAVFQDVATHRRTREVIATVERLGWAVTVVSPEPARGSRHAVTATVGNGAPARLLGSAYGPIARNLTRVLWTIVTLGPRSPMERGLSFVASSILRLEGLKGVLRSDPDVVIVEDVLLLPTVLRHRGQARVVFDAREFFPRQFEHSRTWRLLVGAGLRRALVRLLPDCDAVTTVSDGLAAGYRSLCGVEAVTIRNVPPRSLVPPGAERIGATYERPLRLVFHGRANPNRGLEALIEVGALLRGVAVLDLFLTGPSRYRKRLAALAAERSNVIVHGPVPFQRIPDLLLEHDIGIVFYDATTFNLRHSLPSKFFEFVGAGLPVAIGPSPDMAAVVQRYDCGIVTDDFRPATLAAAIRALSDARIAEMSANARRAARDLVAEVEYVKLERLLVMLVDGSERVR